MKEFFRKCKDYVQTYLYFVGFLVMTSVFAIHVIRDIRNGQYDKIDDHFLEAYKGYASDETMDQADD